MKQGKGKQGGYDLSNWKEKTAAFEDEDYRDIFGEKLKV